MSVFIVFIIQLRRAHPINMDRTSFDRTEISFTSKDHTRQAYCNNLKHIKNVKYLPESMQMEHLCCNADISHSDIYIRFSNVHPNENAGTYPCTGYEYNLLSEKHILRRVSKNRKLQSHSIPSYT
jgi:hypothetical protein